MTPEFLQWDSDHFGVRIARVDAPRSRDEWLTLDDWAYANQIDCMYVAASGKDPIAIRLAEERAARCLGERTILEAIVTDSPAVDGLRFATESDLPWLEDIAAKAFVESRFFRDPHFSPALCEALYRVWIRKSLQGWARAVLVADERGFVTCRDEKIDLLAVADSARGQGVGTTLTNGAKHWFATHGVRRVSVLTRNEVAVKLYQRCGFVPARTEIVFHKWYTD